MLKLFERSTVFQIVVILVVTALLWLPHLANPQPMPEPARFAPLYNILYSCHFTPLLAVLLAMMLVVVGGILLNLKLAGAGLVSQNSLFPTLFYILFMSATGGTLTPSFIVGLLAIAFIDRLLIHSTLLTISGDKIFGATALIGICSLFYLPSLLLLLSYLLVAVSYRLYGWRDWMLGVLGLVAPYFLLWIVQYMNDTLAESFASMGATLTHPHLSVFNFQFSISVISKAFLLLFFAVTLFLLWRQFKERTALWQKNATAVMMLTVGAVAHIFYDSVFPINLQLFAIPFALCASVHFSSSIRHYGYGRDRHQWKKHLKDLLFLIVIVAAIIVN